MTVVVGGAVRQPPSSDPVRRHETRRPRPLGLPRVLDHAPPPRPCPQERLLRAADLEPRPRRSAGGPGRPGSPEGARSFVASRLRPTSAVRRAVAGPGLVAGGRRRSSRRGAPRRSGTLARAHGQRALDAKHVEAAPSVRSSWGHPGSGPCPRRICLEAHATRWRRAARSSLLLRPETPSRHHTRRALDDDLVEPREEVAALPRLELLQCSGEVAVAPAARHGAAVRRLHEVDAAADDCEHLHPELRAVDANNRRSGRRRRHNVLARQDVLEQVALLEGGRKPTTATTGTLVSSSSAIMVECGCLIASSVAGVRFTVDGSTSFRS